MNEKKYRLVSILQSAIVSKFGAKEEMSIYQIKLMDEQEMRKEQHKLERYTRYTATQANYSPDQGRIEYVTKWINDYEPGQLEYHKKTTWIELVEEENKG